MSESDENSKSGDSGSLAIPVIWGVGAGLFAAVLTRGVLAGGIVVVLALIVFAAVVLSARRANRPAPKPRPAQPASVKRRTGPPRPPRAMTEAALEGGAAMVAPENPTRRADWLSQAQQLALGKRDDTQDDDASASKG